MEAAVPVELVRRTRLGHDQVPVLGFLDRVVAADRREKPALDATVMVLPSISPLDRRSGLLDLDLRVVAVAPSRAQRSVDARSGTVVGPGEHRRQAAGGLREVDDLEEVIAGRLGGSNCRSTSTRGLLPSPASVDRQKRRQSAGATSASPDGRPVRRGHRPRAAAEAQTQKRRDSRHQIDWRRSRRPPRTPGPAG